MKYIFPIKEYKSPLLSWQMVGFFSVKKVKIRIISVHMVSGQFTTSTRDVTNLAIMCSFKIQ